MFPDDEMRYRNGKSSPQRELSEVEQQIAEMNRYRQQLIREASKEELDPVIEVAITLAHEAGELKGRYEGQKERNDKQLETIDKQRNTIDDLQGIQQTSDEWRNRAEAAEATLERSRKLKRKR